MNKEMLDRLTRRRELVLRDMKIWGSEKERVEYHVSRLRFPSLDLISKHIETLFTSKRDKDEIEYLRLSGDLAYSYDPFILARMRSDQYADGGMRSFVDMLIYRVRYYRYLKKRTFFEHIVNTQSPFPQCPFYTQ